MNFGPIIDWRQIRKDALSIAGTLGLFAVLLFSLLFVHSHIEQIDAQSGGPYIIEHTDGRQLFVGSSEFGWTPDIKYAHRYGTFAQAQSVQSRIGGMVLSIKEVVK